MIFAVKYHLCPKNTPHEFSVAPAFVAVGVYNVQTHFPPTVEQPLDYKSTMPPVYIESVLNQQSYFKQQPL